MVMVMFLHPRGLVLVSPRHVNSCMSHKRPRVEAAQRDAHVREQAE